MRDEILEQEIKSKNLTAPRVTLDLLKSKIKDTEIVKHVCKSGQVFRWAILTMENGFAVTGKPSCAVSSENDDEEIGSKIAVDNAMDSLWGLEGYLLKENIFNGKVTY